MTIEIETNNGKGKIQDGIPVVGDKPNSQKKAEKADRKAAPKLKVPNREVDWRARKLKELNAKDDGYEYSYINRNKTEWDLEAEGKEIVKDKGGKKLHHKGDPVVRRLKSVADEERKANGEFSEQQVKNIVKTGRTRVTRQKKVPEG